MTEEMSRKETPRAKEPAAATAPAENTAAAVKQAPGTPAEGAAPEETAAAETKRKKSGRYVPAGIAYVHSTFNNTKVTFTDLRGNVLSWSSGGKNGFKGTRKGTAYAAQVIAADAAKKAEALGMKEVEVRINGIGAGRESAVRGIVSIGMEVSTIKDITPVPHNGCRPPKRRHV